MMPISRTWRSSARTRPDYVRLIGGTLLAAFILGIISVWLQGFLGHPAPQATYVSLGSVQLAPQASNSELNDFRRGEARLSSQDTPRLDEPDEPDDDEQNRNA